MTDKTTKTIHVATAADRHYLPHAAAMLCSLFENNADQHFIIYLLHGPGTNDYLQPLNDLCQRYGNLLHPLPVPPNDANEFPKSDRYPAEIWFRFLLPRYLPNLDRLLWLDADTIVRKSIEPLWLTNLNGAPLAAIPCATRRHQRYHPTDIGLSNRFEYFNSGVLLLDLPKSRPILAPDNVEKIVNKLGQNLLFPDQDVLNLLFEKNYSPLPLQWNMISSAFENGAENRRVHGHKQLALARKNPAIVHFTGSRIISKPWLSYSNHPWRSEYLHYRKIAGCTPVEPSTSTLRLKIKQALPIPVWVFFRSLSRCWFGEALEALGLPVINFKSHTAKQTSSGSTGSTEN